MQQTTLCGPYMLFLVAITCQYLLPLVAFSMEQVSSNNEPGSSGPLIIKLTAVYVPGAKLAEPFEIHAILALQRWLLCCGIKPASS